MRFGLTGIEDEGKISYREPLNDISDGALVEAEINNGRRD